jgi:hypothetical protein
MELPAPERVLIGRRKGRDRSVEASTTGHSRRGHAKPPWGTVLIAFLPREGSLCVRNFFPPRRPLANVGCAAAVSIRISNSYFQTTTGIQAISDKRRFGPCGNSLPLPQDADNLP